MNELFNNIKIYFYCSSKQGNGYSWSCINNSKIEIENKNNSLDFGSEEVIKYMTQQGVDFFYLYDNKNYYIGMKNIPHPDGQIFRDRTNSNIFINILFQAKDDSIIRSICSFIFYKTNEFEEMIYSAYNCDDYNNESWFKIGYSFDFDIIGNLLENACKIKNDINFGNFPIDKKEQNAEFCPLNRIEAIGWVLSGVHNSGIKSELFLASIRDIEDYKEKYKLSPYYVLDSDWFKYESINSKKNELEICVKKFIDSRPEKKNLIPVVLKVIFLAFCLVLMHPQIMEKITEKIVILTEKTEHQEAEIQNLSQLIQKQKKQLKELKMELSNHSKKVEKSSEQLEQNSSKELENLEQK